MSWQGTGFYGSGIYTGITNQGSTLSKGMAIKSVSGSEFDLNQFVYLNWGETASFINTVKGYRNGVEVASTTFDGYSSTYTPKTIVLTSVFDNVDEVRFYISAGGYKLDQSGTDHSINSIKVSTPVLGINDFDISSKFTIYPNPATSQVTIDVKELDHPSLEVSDSNGRKIFTQKINNASNTIKTDNLASGFYLFKINSKEGSATTKVIKK